MIPCCTSRQLAAAIALVLTMGCAPPMEPDRSTSATVVSELPISHNELMVALVNHAADPIWVAAWRNPGSEAEWRELERLAYQLRVAGALLEMPGTGPLDRQWAADERWKHWSRALGASGQAALDAAQGRNLDWVKTAGDRIVEACEGCHLEFKPDLPTGGLFGELSPNEDDFED